MGISVGKISENYPIRGVVEELSIADLVSKSEIDLRHVDILRYMDDDATIDLTSLNQGLIERDLTKHIERQLSHPWRTCLASGNFLGGTRSWIKSRPSSNSHQHL